VALAKGLPKGKAKGKAKATATKELPACLQNLPAPCPPNTGGLVYGPDGTRIGRVAAQFMNSMQPSAHCSCQHLGHKPKCAVWVTLSKVPQTETLRQWIQIQDRFKTAEEHMSAFNLLVYGASKGPQGNGKPGG